MLAVERTDRANDDCVAFLRRALPRLALNWPGFRRARRQVCRRLKRRMQSLGLSDFAAYRAHVRAYPEEWAIIDGFCRITISRFLRDKGIFAALGASVLPAMAQRASAEGRGVAAWSAGCASGEEAYSLKIVWEQCVAPGMPAVAFQRVVRHGYGPEREIRTGIDPLAVRDRTIGSKGCLSNKTALAMVFKLIEAAEELTPPRGGEPVAEGRARCQDQRRLGGGNTYRTSAEAAA